MRILSIILAIYWAVHFIAFCFGGYAPSAVGIGIALLQSSLCFVMMAVNSEEGGGW